MPVSATPVGYHSVTAYITVKTQPPPSISTKRLSLPPKYFVSKWGPVSLVTPR